MKKSIYTLGMRTLDHISDVGKGVQIVLSAFIYLPYCIKAHKEVLRQLILCGQKSFGVTSTVALFTGMILALQSGLILKSYGQEMRVGFIVAQTMFREMGPFMTALILAASVGSSMAALIGTMKVSQEIAALEVMSIDPVKFLVTPRLMAMMIMCPVLTCYTDLVGILGGGVVAYTQLDVSWSIY
ncbi:MAG: ABC transporter permease, partial [Lentisphaeria bacterium]|nr:ABC transporter permease [Lentisphaeria bacterium]